VFDRLKDFLGLFRAVNRSNRCLPRQSLRLRNRKVSRSRSGTVNALWTREQIHWDV